MAVDFVDIISSGGLDQVDLDAIAAITTTAGTQSMVIDRATLEMARITRHGTTIIASPPGEFFPMDTASLHDAVPSGASRANVDATLRSGAIVLSRTSATVEQAATGDEVELRAWDGTLHTLVIGAVVDDENIADAEIAIDATIGSLLGVSRPSRVRVWGTRSTLDVVRSTLPNNLVTVASWSPTSPDGTISQARTKQLLGQFAYARDSSGQVTVDSAWKAANLITQKIPLIGTIECHKIVARAAAAALDELRQAGLSRLIDTSDTYQNGGCWGPREQKTSDGTSGRTLSRHAWGAAIDINPTANPQGATPTMDPRVIAAFRRNGFAWGGSFPTPDGMHFEYTGR